MPVDVLQHHDGIVHHQADGQHHRQQRQGVDGETHQAHQGKCTDQRHRDGHQRNDGGTQRTQEDKDDQDDQPHRFPDGDKHVVDRLANKLRVVVGHRHFHAFRQQRAYIGHGLSQAVGDIQRVGGSLLDHAHRHRRLALVANNTAFVRRADFGITNVSQAQQVTARIIEDQLIKLLRGVHVGFREHGEFALLRLNTPRRNLDILPAQGVFHVLHGEVVRGELLRVEPDAHGEGARAANLHFGDAGDGLQAILDHPLQHVGDLHGAVAFAVEGDPDHRLGVGLDLLHNGLGNFIRQQAAHPAQTVAYIVGGFIGVAAQAELRGDLGIFRTADGADEIQSVDARQHVFDRLGDLGLHDLRAGARIGNVNRDNRHVDIRVLAHGQAVIGH